MAGAIKRLRESVLIQMSFLFAHVQHVHVHVHVHMYICTYVLYICHMYMLCKIHIACKSACSFLRTTTGTGSRAQAHGTDAHTHGLTARPKSES